MPAATPRATRISAEKQKDSQSVSPEKRRPKNKVANGMVCLCSACFHATVITRLIKLGSKSRKVRGIHTDATIWSRGSPQILFLETVAWLRRVDASGSTTYQTIYCTSSSSFVSHPVSLARRRVKPLSYSSLCPKDGATSPWGCLFCGPRFTLTCRWTRGWL
jgi:hypothetical protein